jgi:hypothetical protein
MLNVPSTATLLPSTLSTNGSPSANLSRNLCDAAAGTPALFLLPIAGRNERAFGGPTKRMGPLVLLLQLAVSS